MKLIDQINNSFKKNRFTLGVFIYLSKVSAAVDHSILIKILNLFRVIENNLRYLSNRKQYITYSSNKYILFESITWGVPPGSILALLLFVI